MSDLSLKIGRLPDNTPVKLAIEVDPETHADLELYAEIYERAYDQKVDVKSLIPTMLQTFLASDTGFKRARKSLAT